MGALVSAVEGLREVARGGFPAPRRPEPGTRRGLPSPAPPAARRLRAPAPAGHRRPPARGRGRLHRSGQVDPRQLPRRGRGEPVRRAPTDDDLPGAGAPPRRRPVVRRRPHPPRPRPGHRAREGRTPAGHGAPGGVLGTALRAWRCSTPPTSTRSSRPTARSPRSCSSAADLWLFVTTAARYADAVPWDLLRTAADRGTAVAIVLDRIPPDAVDEIRPHLAAHAARAGPPHGSDLHDPGDDARRRRSASGGIGGSVAVVASGARERRPGPVDRRRPDPPWRRGVAVGPHDGARRREPRPARRRGRAAAGRRRGVRAGPPSRERGHDRRHPPARRGAGAVAGVRRHRGVLPPDRDDHLALARQAHRRDQGHAAPVRDTRRGPPERCRRPAPGQRRDCGLRDGPGVASAARRRPRPGCGTPSWRSRPRSLRPTSSASCATGRARCSSSCAREGQGRRTNARIAAYGLNAIGLFLMLVAFSATGGLVGAEIGIAGGTALLAQRVLEAIFGDQAVREMATKARRRLLEFADALYAGERRAVRPRPGRVGTTGGPGARLAAVAAQLRAVVR